MPWVVCTENPTGTFGVDYRLISGHALAAASAIMPFNEGTGSNAADVISSVLCPITAGAWSGGNLVLNGTSSYVNINSLKSYLPSSGAFSLVVRANTTATPGTYDSLVYLGSSSAGILMWWNGGLQTRLRGTGDGIVTHNCVVNTMQTHVVTYDGTTLKGYTDGTQISSTPYAGPYTAPAVLYIGQSELAGRNYPAAVNAVSVYPFALTPTQISDLQTNPWHMFERWEAPSATYLYFTGFESVDADSLPIDPAVTGPLGSAQIQNAVRRVGDHSLQINPVGTETGALYITGFAADGTAGLALNEDTIYVRFYARFSQLPASDSEEIASSVDKLHVRIASDGHLKLYGADGTTLLGTSTTAVVASPAWRRIEFKCGKGTNAAYELKLDGSVEITGTGNVADIQNDNIALGKATDRGGQGYNIYIDSVCIRNDDYPGVGGTIRLRPTGDVSAGSWVGSSAGSLYQFVDDVPFNSADYISTDSATQTEYVAALQDSASAGVGGDVNAVMGLSVFDRSAYGTQDIYGKVRLTADGTDIDGSEIVVVGPIAQAVIAETVEAADVDAMTTGVLGRNGASGEYIHCMYLAAHVECTDPALAPQYSPDTPILIDGSPFGGQIC